MKESLTIKQGEDIVSVVTLDRPLITIGRASACDIRIADSEKLVSRRHALLQRSGTEYRVRNDEGKSGTYLNHERVDDWTPLRQGDLLSIGPYSLTYSFGQPGVDDERTMICEDWLHQPMPESEPVGALPETVQGTARFPEMTAQSELRLRFTKGPFKGGEQIVHRERFSLGRDRQNTVWLNDESVSGAHAEIYQCVGTWFIRDLGSVNGIQVQGRLIDQESALKPGCSIRIGESTFRFFVGRAKRNKPSVPWLPWSLALLSLALLTGLSLLSLSG